MSQGKTLVQAKEIRQLTEIRRREPGKALGFAFMFIYTEAETGASGSEASRLKQGKAER